MTAWQAQGYNSLFSVFSTDQLWYSSDCRPRKLYLGNTFLKSSYLSFPNLLYRHDCFTGKYTARKIHKNYIRDPNGLYYRWGNFGNFPLFILSMFFCLYNKKNITRRLEDMNVGTKSLSKGIMIVFKTKGLQIRCIPHGSLGLSQCKSSCKKHAGWQNLSKDINKF